MTATGLSLVGITPRTRPTTTKVESYTLSFPKLSYKKTIGYKMNKFITKRLAVALAILISGFIAFGSAAAEKSDSELRKIFESENASDFSKRDALRSIKDEAVRLDIYNSFDKKYDYKNREFIEILIKSFSDTTLETILQQGPTDYMYQIVTNIDEQFILIRHFRTARNDTFRIGLIDGIKDIGFLKDVFYSDHSSIVKLAAAKQIYAASSHFYSNIDDIKVLKTLLKDAKKNNKDTFRIKKQIKELKKSSSQGGIWGYISLMQLIIASIAILILWFIACYLHFEFESIYCRNCGQFNHSDVNPCQYCGTIQWFQLVFSNLKQPATLIMSAPLAGVLVFYLSDYFDIPAATPAGAGVSAVMVLIGLATAVSRLKKMIVQSSDIKASGKYKKYIRFHKKCKSLLKTKNLDLLKKALESSNIKLRGVAFERLGQLNTQESSSACKEFENSLEDRFKISNKISSKKKTKTAGNEKVSDFSETSKKIAIIRKTNDKMQLIAAAKNGNTFIQLAAIERLESLGSESSLHTLKRLQKYYMREQAHIKKLNEKYNQKNKTEYESAKSSQRHDTAKAASPRDKTPDFKFIATSVSDGSTFGIDGVSINSSDLIKGKTLPRKGDSIYIAGSGKKGIVHDCVSMSEVLSGQASQGAVITGGKATEAFILMVTGLSVSDVKEGDTITSKIENLKTSGDYGALSKENILTVAQPALSRGNGTIKIIDIREKMILAVIKDGQGKLSPKLHKEIRQLIQKKFPGADITQMHGFPE